MWVWTFITTKARAVCGQSARPIPNLLPFSMWGGVIPLGAEILQGFLSLLAVLQPVNSATQQAPPKPVKAKNQQINSVFVTAESAHKHPDEPHGKKVLYAYFGSPLNHP